MSGTESSQGAVTRRTFLKGAGAAAGALGLAGAAGMTSAGGWLAPAEANAKPKSTWHTRFTRTIARVTAR